METMDYPDGATPLEPDEMEGLKHKHVTKREELDHLEQANIESGLQWLASKRKLDVLDELFMKELHKKLYGEVWTWAGTYRKTEKNIGVDPLQISVQLRSLIDDVKFWIENNTYDAKEIAIRFHHRLVKIHLFPNGNGRHARIMADTLLTKQLDAKPIDWAKGNDMQSMNERRIEYIHALRNADQNDYELLLKFIDL